MTREMQGDDDPDQELDLVWGVENIGKVIKRTPRQTHHMLTTGALPGRRVGGRWVSDRVSLKAHFRNLIDGNTAAA